MSRAPPAVIVASAVSPHVDDLQLNKVKKFVRSHVAYLSGRLFDWERISAVKWVTSDVSNSNVAHVTFPAVKMLDFYKYCIFHA